MFHCSTTQSLPLSDFVPHPKNPNKHDKSQIDRLAKLFQYHGIRHPIIVSKRTGYIVAGHGRLLAAKKLGIKEFPVEYQDFENAAAEYAFLVADNAIADWAELDLSAINALVPELGPDFDIDWLGIKDFEIEPADKFNGDEDAVPDVGEGETRVKLGELWQLGQHRLLCGDCTVKENVERLMGEDKADMVFTDPPYGVNAVHNMRVVSDAPIGFGKTRGENYPGIVKAKSYKPIHADDKPFDPIPIIALAPKAVLFGGNYFHDKLPLGWRWLVWDKKAEKGTDEGPFSDCELIWTNLEGRAVKIYRHCWAGLLREGPRNEELKERVHPTQKPVGLCTQILEDLKPPSVIDPFLGSGSTLIACEKTGRKCYGMEIDPHYCDVILKRWEQFTGKQAVKIG